ARSVFWGPMAITIMGGLFVATVLTLLVVPALYALWFRVRAEEEGRQSDGFDIEAEPARPFDPGRMAARIAAEWARRPPASVSRGFRVALARRGNSFRLLRQHGPRLRHEEEHRFALGALRLFGETQAVHGIVADFDWATHVYFYSFARCPNCRRSM